MAAAASVSYTCLRRLSDRPGAIARTIALGAVTVIDSDRFSDLFQLVERLAVALESRRRDAWDSFADLATLEPETNYVANGTTLSTSPKTSNLFLVRCAVAVIPSGASGNLGLGAAIIPIAQPLTVIPHLELLLSPADSRNLTSTVAGPMSLVLTGRQEAAGALLR